MTWLAAQRKPGAARAFQWYRRYFPLTSRHTTSPTALRQ
jgi:hypothetical protein